MVEPTAKKERWATPRPVVSPGDAGAPRVGETRKLENTMTEETRVYYDRVFAEHALEKQRA